MNDVFEEWSAYAGKKALKRRDVDLSKIESSSRLKIVSITGIRRCGKSSVLMMLCQKLAKEEEKTAYVNVEDSRIKDEKSLLDNILKWFGDSGYLLLDEISSADDWEGWLARNHELLKGKLNVIVSSSRSNLVFPSKPLRGRLLNIEMYPLSYLEFLEFNEISVERTVSGRGRLERALSEYLIYGGFPEVALLENKTDKILVLSSYFKDIVGLDVAEISGENASVVETFGNYALSSPYFSASKCLNFFKSLGHKIGKQAILDLERYSEESYLFFFVPIFSFNIKDKSQYPRKAYAGDTGFSYAMKGKTDWGRLYENAVYLQLRRQLPANSEINYWKNKQGLEVDFIIRTGAEVTKIYQVCYDFSDEKTKKREIDAIVECAREFGKKTATLITKNDEGNESLAGVRIKYIPLWKWLLE